MNHGLIAEMRDLSRTPLFSGCTRRQLDRADRYLTFINIEPGRVLHRRGEWPDTLVILINGQALAISGSTGIRILGAGESIGALAPPVAGVGVADITIALTAGMIAALTPRELAGLLDACPSVASRLQTKVSTSRSSATTTGTTVSDTTQRASKRIHEGVTNRALPALTNSAGH